MIIIIKNILYYFMSFIKKPFDRWSISAEDAAISCGYTPIHKVLDLDEHIICEEKVCGRPLALTNKGNLLYITDFYDANGVHVPRVCRDVYSECTGMGNYSHYKRELLNREYVRSVYFQEPSEVISHLYMILGVEPGEIYEDYLRLKRNQLRNCALRSPTKMQGVYFISEENELTLIGCTFDLASTMESLRVAASCPQDLEFFIKCDNCNEIEAALHEKFKAKRKNGALFALDDEDYDKILDGRVNLGLAAGSLIAGPYALPKFEHYNE